MKIKNKNEEFSVIREEKDLLIKTLSSQIEKMNAEQQNFLKDKMNAEDTINVLKNEIEKIKLIYEEKVKSVEQRSFKL